MPAGRLRHLILNRNYVSIADQSAADFAVRHEPMRPTAL